VNPSLKIEIQLKIIYPDLRIYLLAKQSDGLHKAALANCGSFDVYTARRDDIALSLEDLIKRSSTIVVATPSEERTYLVDDGRYIVTEYSVRVTRVLKGPTAASDHETLVMVGGTYKFEDGTRATDFCECRKPRIGHSYVIFSNPLRSSSRKLVPSFEDQGIVELASDGIRVIPYSTHFYDFFNRCTYEETETQIPFLTGHTSKCFEQTQTQFLGNVQALIANQSAKRMP
jgi:hypothetical protein